MYHDSRLFSEDILTAFYHHISLHVPQLLYLFKIRSTQPTSKNAVHVGRNPGWFITFSGYQIPSPQSFQLLPSLPHIHNATHCNFFHMMEHTRLAKAFVFCFKEYLAEGTDIRMLKCCRSGLLCYKQPNQNPIVWIKPFKKQLKLLINRCFCSTGL